MEYLIIELLDQDSARRITSKILSPEAQWEDGKNTAGSHAAKVKNNFQLSKASKISEDLSESIALEITKNQLIKSFALPKKVHGVTFTRASSGQGYGTHVDNAYMSSGRSDLSFTLFLNNPTEYEGGSLSIQSIQENKEIKLKAGQIIIYPSTSIHSVETVTNGERLVCIGWIQSYISSNEDRNTLFNLDAGARGLLSKYGRSPELDLVFQSYTNLLRRLGC